MRLETIIDISREYPGFLPGLALSIVLSVVLAGRVGRALGTRAGVGGLLILGFGIVISATLTPGREALAFGNITSGYCDLSRWRPAPLSLLSINNTSLNMYMVVPLGIAIGLLPRSSRKVSLVILAALLPINIETFQAMFTALGRVCQSGDVVDNEVGLAVGLAVGVLAGRLLPGLGRSGGPGPLVPGTGPR